MDRTLKTIAGQTSYDLTVQAFGGLDDLDQVLREIPDLNTSIPFSTELVLPDTDDELARQFEFGKIAFATGEQLLPDPDCLKTIFDGVIYGEIPDEDDFKISDFGIRIKFNTGDYTQIGGAAAFMFSLGGSFNDSEGLQLQFFEPGSIRLFFGNDFSSPLVTSASFEFNTDYDLTIEYRSDRTAKYVVNDVEIPIIFIPTAPPNWGTNPTFIGTGSLDGTAGYPGQWWNGALYNFEYYEIDTNFNKTKELINLDISRGTNTQVPNAGINAPLGTNMLWSGTPVYLPCDEVWPAPINNAFPYTLPLTLS